MGFIRNTYNLILEKLNPAQGEIARDSGDSKVSDSKLAYSQAFEKLESVNRGVSMVVNGCASLDYDIKDGLPASIVKGVKRASLHNLLNFRPNPYQSAHNFRLNIFTDLILEGNAFIYFDGVFIYHLPAASVEILTDPKTFIKGYKYNSEIEFDESEVFSFKDITSGDIYRGTSRLQSAQKSINTLYNMQTFQDNFFANGAVFGLILTSDNTLSKTAKENTINNWIQKYNPKMGGKRPVILDSGLKPHSVSQDTFKDMDFDASMSTHNKKILQAIGVPPILLDGGNNANINPNLRLFYLETILPIVRGYTSALERYFGFDIEPVTATVSALQPDIKEKSDSLSSLANNGLMTVNECRIELRLPPMSDPKYNELREPRNITGSAANPSVGGRPPEPSEDSGDSNAAN